MSVRTGQVLAAIATAAIAAGGCSNNGTTLQTSAVSTDKPTVAAAPRVDPACMSLASQIDTLRQEGSIDRLEKAAAGKTASVQVKRATLAKQAELNKAYGEFQTKCGPALLRSQTTALSTTPPTAVAAKAASTTKPATVQAQPSAATAAAPAAAAATSEAKTPN